MTNAYMPQAKTVEHTTPPDLFDALNREFGPFTLDPAAQPGQYTAETIWDVGGEYMIPPPLDSQGEPTGVRGPAFSGDTGHTERVFYDGLKMPWQGRVYLNPPYGRQMPKWIEKAVSEIQAGNVELVCALIPSRTDTKMWQKYILKEAAFDRIAAPDSLTLVRFLPGRLKFGDSKAPAPFPSAVVVWERR